MLNVIIILKILLPLRVPSKKTRLPCQQPLYASQMPHRGLTIRIISAVMGNHMFSSVAATAAVVRSSLNYYCHLPRLALNLSLHHM